MSVRYRRGLVLGAGEVEQLRVTLNDFDEGRKVTVYGKDAIVQPDGDNWRERRVHFDI